MFLAPWPTRRRDKSSPKVTLRTQCSLFSWDRCAVNLDSLPWEAPNAAVTDRYYGRTNSRSSHIRSRSATGRNRNAPAG